MKKLCHPELESALSFAGYDVAHAWGGHGHNGQAGAAILPDVLRWLWRDYPAPIKAGVSKNSTLQEITLPDEGWQKIPAAFQAAAGLAANLQGQVCLSDTAEGKVCRLDAGDEPVVDPPLSFSIPSALCRPRSGRSRGPRRAHPGCSGGWSRPSCPATSTWRCEPSA